MPNRMPIFTHQPDDMKTDSITYPSSMNVLLVAFHIGLPLIGLIAAIGMGNSIGVFLAFTSVFLLALVLPCRYVITSDSLILQSGIHKKRIPLKHIVSVNSSRNPLPMTSALSFRRLKIYTNNRFRSFFVSPKDRDGFIHHLNEQR